MNYKLTRINAGQSNPIRNLKESTHGSARIFYLFIIFLEDGQKIFFIDKCGQIDCDLDFVKIRI